MLPLACHLTTLKFLFSKNGTFYKGCSKKRFVLLFAVFSLINVFLKLLQVQKELSNKWFPCLSRAMVRLCTLVTRTIRLLSSMGLPLVVFFRTVGQFAMSKASFGWVCRSPPKTVSDKLWAACWVAADRARYSSPFVRSILFGGVYHLDALWAARLVTALLRYSLRFQGCPPWSLRFGSPCATLNTWLLRCHWVRVRPWVWEHPLGGAKLDLSVRLSPQLVDGWINHCRHALRVGWRAYQFKEWCASSRHELLEIPSPWNWFQKINWGDARDWATTTASAATVCLGATYSLAHWQHWLHLARVLLSRSFPSCLLGVCFPSPLRPYASCFPLSCSLRLVRWGRPTNCPIGPCLALFRPVPALEGSIWLNPVCPSFLGLLTLSPWLAVWPYPWWLLFVCNTCLTKEILFHSRSFRHTPSSSSARWGLLCAIDFAVVQCKDFSLHCTTLHYTPLH